MSNEELERKIRNAKKHLDSQLSGLKKLQEQIAQKEGAVKEARRALELLENDTPKAIQTAMKMVAVLVTIQNGDRADVENYGTVSEVLQNNPSVDVVGLGELSTDFNDEELNADGYWIGFVEDDRAEDK